jgi:RimK family alpha-L-glutamate ligase
MNRDDKSFDYSQISTIDELKLFYGNHMKQKINEAEDDKTSDEVNIEKNAKDGDPEQATDQAAEQTGNKKNIVKSEDDEELGKHDDRYFFKNIIFFTNERDPEKNKTLKNLTEAIEDKNIKLITFVAKEVDYTATNDEIVIKDSKEEFKINEQSNVDTIVIVRLGAQESEECMECIKELQDWGLFVLNPIQAAKRASNKYAASVLMQRYEIPQPRFCLLSIRDIKDGEESLKKKLKLIYPDVGENEDKDKDKEYVVKILDGHGGTGVTMQTGKSILSMLQMAFAIDEERELLLQKKEEADGGDIRVHVLTSRTKQTILAQMKRKKLGGDFRSNVSLGAQAEKVEITEEQKEIALKVAKISGMPWCAVDIMPLKKGSNKEIGDNVVLEYNASPGTDGISEVIGENFCKILLDSINDINELVLAPKSIGYIEKCKFSLDKDNEFELDAKFDTGNGAKASTLGCDKLETDENVIKATINGKEYKFKRSGTSYPIVGQTREERLTVKISCIQIGTRKLLDVDFALVDNRKEKSTPVLINRDVMAKMAYLINPGAKNTFDDEFHSSEYNKHNREK